MAIDLKLEKEYVFYVNGEYVPWNEAKISVLDSGCHGDSVYDTLRTVSRTNIFRIDDHIERLYSSCNAADIDPGIGPEEMKKIMMEVTKRNAPLLSENDDAWVFARVTSGSMFEGGKPTVIVFFLPLLFKRYAKFFKLGTHLVVTQVRHVPAQCIDPKIKNDSRLFMHIADREVRRSNPECRTLMMDINGNISELTDANFFIVKKGEVITPTTSNVLPGVSRQIVLELCEKLEIKAFEKDIQLYDVYNADEAFQTGTSYRMLPVSRINRRHLWKEIPGPITKRLLKAYNEEIGLDIAEQYLSHLSEEEREELH